MIELSQKQQATKAKIELFAKIFNIDPEWASAIAMTESSLGLRQRSKTGCKGVFQMSSIAMKDLLNDMEKIDEDLGDIACGVAFLALLKKRWKTMESATLHFCDPKDKEFYKARVLNYMSSFKK
jgi:hypothetical protein